MIRKSFKKENDFNHDFNQRRRKGRKSSPREKIRSGGVVEVLGADGGDKVEAIRVSSHQTAEKDGGNEGHKGNGDLHSTKKRKKKERKRRRNDEKRERKGEIEGHAPVCMAGYGSLHQGKKPETFPRLFWIVSHAVAPNGACKDYYRIEGSSQHSSIAD